MHGLATSPRILLRFIQAVCWSMFIVEWMGKNNKVGQGALMPAQLKQ